MGKANIIIWPNNTNKESLYAQVIGYKAIGLLSLPQAWVPPFFVLSTTLHARWQRHKDNSAVYLESSEQSALEKAIDTLTDNGASQLVVRSSADSEKLEARGRFISVRAKPFLSSVLNAIKRLYQASEINDVDRVRLAIVVQRIVEPAVSLGHLSNERRVSNKLNHWICEIQKSPSALSIGVFKIIVMPFNLLSAHLDSDFFSII